MVFLFFTYTGWIAYITTNGACISKIKTPRYTIAVLRMPHSFSYFTPVYGMRWFPGYVLIRISDTFGREITSYSVNWDSFYPERATATASRDDLITIDVEGQPITCQISIGEIRWSTKN
jgi:hypothetical protein